MLCIFGSHTCVPVSWSCKKQTAVSDSSTEADIISLDCGLRLEGIPTLNMWDIVIDVLEPLARSDPMTKRSKHPEYKRKKNRRIIDALDDVPPNAHVCSQRACWERVFEDNEAVIKMIEKGRSPTLRHVSRTHRGDLEWLVDRINLDPGIQIKYVQHQPANRQCVNRGLFLS